AGSEPYIAVPRLHRVWRRAPARRERGHHHLSRRFTSPRDRCRDPDGGAGRREQYGPAHPESTRTSRRSRGGRMTRRRPSARLVSTGRFIPERVVTNDEMATIVETSDEWIRTRTGIRTRHIASPDTGAADMGAAAARAALDEA